VVCSGRLQSNFRFPCGVSIGEPGDEAVINELQRVVPRGAASPPAASSTKMANCRSQYTAIIGPPGGSGRFHHFVAAFALIIFRPVLWPLLRLRHEKPKFLNDKRASSHRWWPRHQCGDIQQRINFGPGWLAQAWCGLQVLHAQTEFDDRVVAVRQRASAFRTVRLQ